MSTPDPDPTDDARLSEPGALPPEHPAGSDAPVSAGEALSNEGIGTGQLTPDEGTPGREGSVDRAPGDDS